MLKRVAVREPESKASASAQSAAAECDGNDPVDRAAGHRYGLADACVSGPGVPTRVPDGRRARRGAGGMEADAAGELVGNIGVSFWRAGVGLSCGGIGFAFGLMNACRSQKKQVNHTTLQDGAQHSASRAESSWSSGFGIDEAAKLFWSRSGCSSRSILNTLRHSARRTQLIEMGVSTE